MLKIKPDPSGKGQFWGSSAFPFQMQAALHSLCAHLPCSSVAVLLSRDPFQRHLGDVPVHSPTVAVVPWAGWCIPGLSSSDWQNARLQAPQNYREKTAPPHGR